MKRMIWIGIVSAILGIGHLISVAIASPLAPPPEYDHGFVGVVTVTRVSDRGKMEEICRKPRAIGCASHYTAVAVTSMSWMTRHLAGSLCLFLICLSIGTRLRTATDGRQITPCTTPAIPRR
jgi:hypothetical protein